MADFRFFKMAAATILDFGNFKFLTIGAVKRVELHDRAKFRPNRSNRSRDIVIFKLLGCWLPPSWISLDVKFVTDQTVTRAELRHRAKFC